MRTVTKTKSWKKQPLQLQSSSKGAPLTLTIKDPGSAITHLIGAVLTLGAAVPIITRAALHGESVYVISAGIFMLTMLMMYTASTVYHTLDISETVNRRLRKLDHMMIFVFVAGSYTPICLITLRGMQGTIMLAAVWGIALLGIAIKCFWITCPKWFSSVLYIAMGWVCIFALPSLLQTLSGEGFLWLLAGGILYTIGGVIYALKLSLFNERFPSFGSHEIFHLFVMAGSFCHYIVMYEYVIM